MSATFRSADVKDHWMSLQEISSGVNLRGNFCVLCEEEVKPSSENKVGSGVVSSRRMEQFQFKIIDCGQAKRFPYRADTWAERAVGWISLGQEMYWEGLAKPQGIEGAGETILEESDLEESEARR